MLTVERAPVRHRKTHRALRALAGAGAIIYLVATAVYLVFHGSWPTPDFLIPPLLLFAIIAGRGWSFLIDWLPFLLVILAYQSFAGIADDLNARVHFYAPILADHWLLRIDTPAPLILQDRFFHPERVMWYDWVASGLHAAHFVTPAILGFLLWLNSRRTFWRYVATLLVLFFAGFLTYYLFPVAPPWLAAEQELIPPVTRVLIQTLAQFPASEPLALLYQYFSPNDVAAMPSLHAGAPALLALVATALWGRRGLPLFAYPLAAGTAWVYLGEHYVIDVVAGWLYAFASFLWVWLTFPRFVNRLQQAIERQRLWFRPPALPSWPLALFAGAFIVLVWIDPIYKVPLHPEKGPLIPAAGVRAGMVQANSPDDFDPRDCRQGTSTSLILDRALQPLAGQYAGYLVALDGTECFSITRLAEIPPPTRAELARIDRGQASRTPERLRLVSEPLGYLTMVRVGVPADILRERNGLSGERLYAIVIRVDNTDHQAEVQQVIEELAALIFRPTNDSH